MSWEIKIDSDNCPYKKYPTHTKSQSWFKGYCKVSNGVVGIDIVCNPKKCPIKV